MDHVSTGIRSLLSFSFIYDNFLKLVGYDKALVELVRTYIKPFPKAKILDVGCGTSMILQYLPSDICYHGFDMNEKYIEKSREQFSDSVNYKFFNNRVSESTITEPDTFDIVIAISILHHLDDNEARHLFQSAFFALKPGGRLITYDPVNKPDQSLFIKTFNRFDRGQNIRTPSEYHALVQGFKSIKSFVRDDMGWRIPGEAFIFECTK